jgi:site-specific DNA recombinase
MYADGHSLKRIAKRLNAEKIKSPHPALGRIQQSWCPSSIRVILRNERYRGVVYFGKTRKVKNPITKKRIQRANAVSEMIRREFPEQRIISDILWKRVQARMAQVKAVFGERGRRGGLARTGNAAGNPYIFSGLLKCSECGANLIIVSGRGKNHGQPHYGCPMNAFRNTCSNNVKIRKDLLESQLLDKLQNEVLREEVIEYALSRFEAELTKAVRDISGQMASLEAKRRRIEKELGNLTKAVASGLDSKAVRAEIVDREREIQNIDSQIIAAKPESVRVKIQDARKFVESSLKDIRKLLGTGPIEAKATIARHMPSIVLKPTTRPDGRRMYQVVSEWELPEGGVALLSGAEGQS